MPRIYLFIPYFGKFPNYFQLYLDSLSNNIDILSVFFLTDIDMSGYTVPENAIILPTTKETLQIQFSHMLQTIFGKYIEPSKLILNNYKLVDFKVTYPATFSHILDQYRVAKDDYVGWGDCDLIYGKLSNFIDFKQNYDILGGYWGHFTAIRNDADFKVFFKDVPGFFELCTDNSKTFITDEIACREPLLHFLKKNNYTMFYMNQYCCDIIPPCFFHMFRTNHASMMKNFFDNTHPSKNIHHAFVHKNGKLSIVYDDGFTREATYAHLQKRAMNLPKYKPQTGYFIMENAFHYEI